MRLDISYDLAEPNWQDIEKTVFAWEDQCWLTCGGYCCGTTHLSDFKFRILPLDASAIVYLGDEFDWMQQYGTPLPASMRKREFSFDFGGPKPLRIMVADCSLKGQCDGCLIKPLQCRIYPFIPIFEIDGTLTDLYPGSIYDLTFMRSDDKTPCTVWHRKRDHYLEFWKTSPHTDLLRHPRLMFYFAAYKLFADIYLEKLAASEGLAGLKGEDFWSRWELLYLGRTFFDGPRTKAGVHAIYEQYRAKYGDFLGT